MAIKRADHWIGAQSRINQRVNELCRSRPKPHLASDIVLKISDDLIPAEAPLGSPKEYLSRLVSNAFSFEKVLIYDEGVEIEVLKPRHTLYIVEVSASWNLAVPEKLIDELLGCHSGSAIQRLRDIRDKRRST